MLDNPRLAQSYKGFNQIPLPPFKLTINEKTIGNIEMRVRLTEENIKEITELCNQRGLPPAYVVNEIISKALHEVTDDEQEKSM